MAAIVNTHSTAESMVVISLPAISQPMNLIIKRDRIGDLIFTVCVAVESNAFVAQFTLPSFLFPLSETLLENDAPGVCGVLRNGHHIIGEIGFYENQTLKLSIGSEHVEIPLTGEDIADIIYLMQGA